MVERGNFVEFMSVPGYRQPLGSSLATVQLLTVSSRLGSERPILRPNGSFALNDGLSGPPSQQAESDPKASFALSGLGSSFLLVRGDPSNLSVRSIMLMAVGQPGNSTKP